MEAYLKGSFFPSYSCGQAIASFYRLYSAAIWQSFPSPHNKTFPYTIRKFAWHPFHLADRTSRSCSTRTTRCALFPTRALWPSLSSSIQLATIAYAWSTFVHSHSHHYSRRPTQRRTYRYGRWPSARHPRRIQSDQREAQDSATARTGRARPPPANCRSSPRREREPRRFFFTAY